MRSQFVATAADSLRLETAELPPARRGEVPQALGDADSLSQPSPKDVLLCRVTLGLETVPRDIRLTKSHFDTGEYDSSHRTSGAQGALDE